MLELKSLIGLDPKDAEKILKEYNINDVEVVLNSKHNEKVDSLVVCAARKEENKVILICGEFYLNL